MQHYAATKHGIDISQVRLDDLDRKIINFALNWKGRKVAIDFGSGEGRVSIILALIGFEVHLYDTRDLSEHFTQLAKSLKLEDRIHFHQTDISKLNVEDLPEEITILIAQRVLHYLKFEEAKKLIQIASKKMQEDAQLFASVTGLNSQIGESYPDKDKNIEDRFAEVSGDAKDIFSIHNPVCLYEQDDTAILFKESTLLNLESYVSKFGNIKVIYKK